MSGLDLAGRTHVFGINRILADLQGMHGHKFPKQGTVELSETAREELLYWKNIKSHPPRNFREVKRSLVPLKYYTDASTSHFGVKLGNRLVRGEFPLIYQASNIQTKEAYALYFYIKEFAPVLSEITVMVDNLALVCNFKKRMSRNSEVNLLLRDIFQILRSKKTVVNLVWISTTRMLEEGADGVTRAKFIDYFSDDKSLSPEGKIRLLELSGLDLKRTTDAFASSIDNVLKVPYAHINWDTSDELALGLDAFEFFEGQEGKRIGFHIYAYPLEGFLLVGFSSRLLHLAIHTC